ncbi:MAG: lipid IV(A) 3-deoxy-D-manno-octulosonic acid transferase [Rickettsia endosymbiont of Bryobia graminum]|nr:lipid IV(A) 3-deoxy-D-manno-octulosonic acid transferase [Rickettsia endosymbiont of Bryobia graminum]
MIYLYNILSFFLLPIYLINLVLRIIKRKEDLKRIGERFAISKFHTESNSNLIWIHAASVGESTIALNLIENINNLYSIPLQFLITSTTRSSAKILKQKLPKNAIHQFVPIDNIIFVRKFFHTWRPHIGIFIESELWPCLISEGSKYCKILLLNARISDKSFKRWQKFNSLFRDIVTNFSQIIVQSNKDFQKYTQLGVTNNILNLGNIKFANKPLTVNKEELLILSQHLAGKKIIVFASTHIEDEQVVLNVIKPIKSLFANCYFILIPRHPERKEDIGKICNQLGLNYSIKSNNNLPILTDDLYIVDKFGELGLFFSLAYISFIGGSFKQGGHNILEPGYFSNYIIFGPNMSNSANLAKDMLDYNAATQIQNEEELFNKIKYILSEQGSMEAKTYQDNALRFVSKNQQILNNYLTIIEKYLGK